MAGGRAEKRTTKAISKSGGSENALRGVGWGWWRRKGGGHCREQAPLGALTSDYRGEF